MTNLILAVIAGLPLYTAFCLLQPTRACRRCSGWGSKPGRRRWGRQPQRRQCRKCDGTGRRFRLPARLVHRLRGAMRRHGELAARAADRADGTSRSDEERERVTS